MRILKGAVLVLCMMFLLMGCDQVKKYISPATQFFQGDHELRRFSLDRGTHSRGEGAYFLISGSMQSKSDQIIEATFSWKGNDGDYIISTVPYTKIRVRIDNNVTAPYVKFMWNNGTEATSETVAHNHTELIVYVVVVCAEADYPGNIDLVTK